MKKKTLIIIIAAAVVVAAIGIVAISLLTKKPETVQTIESIGENYQNSLEKVKTVQTSMSYADEGKIIYSEKRTLNVDGASGVLSVEKTQIDSTTYKPVIKTDTQNVTITPDYLKAIELDSSLVNMGYTIENGVLQGRVSDKNVQAFFGGNLNSFGGVAFSVTVKDNLITSIEYSFTTLDLKQVEVSISYAY